MSQHPAPVTNPAALPWYNFTTTRHALDSVWHVAREQLRGIDQTPIALDHISDCSDLLKYPKLTLSQCCGLDLFQAHTSMVVPFAVPVITALGLLLQLHRRAVIGDSGHTVLKVWLHSNNYDDYTMLESGSHAQSVIALQQGQADLAAIDALTWRHLDTKGLQILDRSEPAPAPPFIRGEHSSIPADALTAALDTGFERYARCRRGSRRSFDKDRTLFP